MSKISVSSSYDPLSNDLKIVATVPSSLIASQLETNLYPFILREVINKASSEILKEHGKDLLNNVTNEIKNKIVEAICKNIEWFAHELMILQRDFDNKELCQCGQVHGKLKSSLEALKHPFVPMTNLQYLEHRYDRVQKWVKSLNYA